MSNADKSYPTAALFEERYGLAKGWQILVARARRMGTPLYHVRSASGTTLDMVATIQEARNTAARERAHVFEYTALGQRRIA